MYTYASYRHGRSTVIEQRVRAGQAGPFATTVAVGTWALWWPWLDPVELDLGDNLRVMIMPYQGPVEGDDTRWRATAQARGMRQGNVSAVRLRYGVRQTVAMDEAEVHAALTAWEAVQVLGA